MDARILIGGVTGLASIISMCIAIALLLKVNYMVMKMRKQYGSVPKMETPPPPANKKRFNEGDRKGNLKPVPMIDKKDIAPPPSPKTKLYGCAYTNA